MILVSPDPFDPGEELAAFAKRAGEGAVLSFTGVVRGNRITELVLDHYPGFTERELEKILTGIIDRHQLTAATLRHRVGPIGPGEPIMFAATSAPHRRAAFEALDELMDRLKKDAPFWKKERGPDGERWIEASEGDERDYRRWSGNDG